MRPATRLPVRRLVGPAVAVAPGFLLTVVLGLGVTLGGCRDASDAEGGVITPTSGPVTRTTDEGLYRVALESAEKPIPLRAIHEWRVSVRTGRGEPVPDATVRVDGGMPAHQHGLPTVPRVTEHLGDGVYRLEGMKFSMSGHWTLDVSVLARAGTDSVTFDLELP